MTPAKYHITLDIDNSAAACCMELRQGESGRLLAAELTQSGKLFSPEGCRAVCAGTRPDGKVFFDDCAIEGEEIIFTVLAGHTAVSGELRAEIRLYGEEDRLIASPGFTMKIAESAMEEGELMETEEAGTLTRLIGEAQEAIDACRATAINDVELSLVENEGEPAASVELLEDEERRYMRFCFENLRGEAGPAGAKGEKGDTGPAGERGEKGERGEQGIQGEPGPKGEKGESGAQGVPGEKGEPGKGFRILDYFASLSLLQGAVSSPAPGDAYGVGTAAPYDIYIFSASSGWVNNGPIQGAKGEKGEKGEKGDAGAAFTYDMFTPDQLSALKGEKGDTGPAGEQGQQGIQGEPGPRGEKGETGAQGEKGEKGDSGTQGPQGERGEKGEKGEKGDTGAAFTYDMFTPEQLSALKGEKGDAGDTGPQGIQGEPGPQGEKGEKGDTGAQGEKGEKGDSGASPFSAELSLSTEGWTGTAAPYTNTVALSGITAADRPFVDIVHSSDAAAVAAEREAWAMVYRAVTGADTIIFHATGKPAVALNVQIMAVRE